MWSKDLVAPKSSQQTQAPSTTRKTTLPVGTKLSLNGFVYVIEEHIGQGGLGNVYRVSRQTQVACMLAISEPLPCVTARFGAELSGRLSGRTDFHGFYLLSRRIFSRTSSAEVSPFFLPAKKPDNVFQEKPRQYPPNVSQQESPTTFRSFGRSKSWSPDQFQKFLVE